MRSPSIHRLGARRQRRLAVLAATALSASVTCGDSFPVAWDGEHRVAGLVAPGVTLVLGDGDVPAILPAIAPLRWPSDSLACPGTRAAIAGPGDTLVAAWWSGDSAAYLVLRTARSPDGGLNWDSPVAAGLATPGASRCTRPPPGIAVDGGTGDVLLAYQGRADTASGIVVSVVSRASGRARAPQLVAPGERPAMAAIAAAGDTVIVAFEAPYAGDASVWLAISSGSGHIPSVAGRASSGRARAFAPIAALRGSRIAVAWIEARNGSAGPSVVARVGTLRR